MSATKETVVGLLRGNGATDADLQQLQTALNLFGERSALLKQKQSIPRFLTQAAAGVTGAASARFFFPGLVAGPVVSTIAVAIAGVAASYGGAKAYDAIASMPREEWSVLNSAIEKLLENRLTVANIIEFLNRINEQLQNQLNTEETKSMIRAVTTGVYPAICGPYPPPASVTMHAITANVVPLDKVASAAGLISHTKDVDTVVRTEDQELRRRHISR